MLVLLLPSDGYLHCTNTVVWGYRDIHAYRHGNLRVGFELIGGSAMIMLGGDQNTEDVDVAVNAEALYAFDAAVATKPRFLNSPEAS